MKKKNYNLVKTKNLFILVSDEPIKKGDTTLSGNVALIEGWNWGIKKIEDDETAENENKLAELTKDTSIKHSPLLMFKKIIAGIEGYPSTDFSLLKEKDCKTIGWVDVEKLAENKITDNADIPVNFFKSIWKDGLKTAQSLNDKQFSDKIEKQISDFKHDLREATSTYIKQNCEGAIFGLERLKQSLQQSEWDVEVNELNQITKIL